MLKSLPKSRILVILLIGAFFIFAPFFYFMFYTANPSLSADYSPNNSWIVTTNTVSRNNSVIRIWNTQNNRQISQSHKMEQSSRVMFSPDNNFLIGLTPNIDSQVYVYSTENLEITQIRSYARPVCGVAVSSNSVFVMVCGYDRNAISVTELIDNDGDLLGQSITQFDSVQGSGEVHISLNGSENLLLAALSTIDSTTIEIRDTTSYNLQSNIRLNTEITGIDWVGDDRLVTIDSGNNLVILDSVTSEQVSNTITPFLITSIDVSPNGKFLLAGGECGTILYSLSDMQQLATLEPNSVVSARFNASGTHALIASSSVRQPYIEIDISEFVLEQE